MTNANEFPPGWDAERVRRVIEYYEARMDDDVLDEEADDFADQQELYAELGLTPPEAPAKAAG